MYTLLHLSKLLTLFRLLQKAQLTFISAIPIGFQIANKNKEAFLQDIGRAKFAENLRAELSNDTTFILIHLVGQYR